MNLKLTLESGYQYFGNEAFSDILLFLKKCLFFIFCIQGVEFCRNLFVTLCIHILFKKKYFGKNIWQSGKRGGKLLKGRSIYVKIQKTFKTHFIAQNESKRFKLQFAINGIKKGQLEPEIQPAKGAHVIMLGL